ncbi:hypothetical protein [uncultured Leifsonia sp.]|uniref:hypothetical protein n=1 Tax=uncultured Leifsonia sp. TaxID=340359 RepID=UPI0025EED2FC|nr:hypothetical protein [uncultured Leifsonia sp.]
MMFLSLADEYAGLLDFLNAPNRVVMGPPRTEADRTAHWHRLLRAAVSRKFITQGDGAYLGDVFTSMARLRSSESPPVAVQDLQERLNRIRTDSLGSYVLAGHPPTSEPEIFWDVIYGQLMHGDYERWYRSNARAGTGWDVNAVAMVLSQVEQLVLGTRTAIVEGLERGYLRLGGST